MKLILLVVFSVFCFASPKAPINKVNVIDGAAYICKVIQAVVSEVERMEWCNLKLSDIAISINETVIDRHFEGTIQFTNGFVVSIQHIDVRKDSIKQNWSWSSEKDGKIAMIGALRMTDVALGYDVTATLQDGNHRYTAIYTHPLISFLFTMNYDIATETVETTTVEWMEDEFKNIVLDIIPKGMTGDVIAVLFDPKYLQDGIKGLGANVFHPILANVVHDVEFPRICYDCPA